MIQLIGDQTPSIPESFARRLQAFDRDLLVVWHKSPFTKQAGRWKIERCTRHFGQGFDLSGRPLHDHTCQRIYIVMCQDEEGTPMPLGDWIFEKLRAMRSRWEELGGDSERGIQNALRHSDAIDERLAVKREAGMSETMRYNRKDNRVTFNRLMNLIERHDVRPN